MSHPASAKSIAELRSLSDAELIEQHDILAGDAGGGVGVNYYLAELERRRAGRQAHQMLALTWVVAALTVVNVVAVIISLT
jgi:hypothetical protein